ncbi:MAG: hypothetical protein WD069_21625 [Planctomycetales bacterium]
MRGFEPDYSRWLDALIARRAAPVELMAKAARQGKMLEREVYKASPVYEVYNRLPEDKSAVRYVAGAMARVDPRYTEITYEEGDRIRNQLEKALNAADATCEFEYQGSVASDIHIKSYSDIDLLAITSRFWTLEPPQRPSHPYKGDPVRDLKAIRATACEALRKEFPAAEVDDSGAKSVCIAGGSLRRKVDVVPANWFNTNAYAETLAKRFRAVQVLDVKTGERVKNSPFLHNYLIQQRDAATRGGLRKVIRLMKSLKYDSGRVNLTSYDLTAIGYNMPEDELVTAPGEEVALLSRLKQYLDDVVANEEFRREMLTPDNSRKVFADGHATLAALQMLQYEVNDLVDAVRYDLHRSFAKLAEARLAY